MEEKHPLETVPVVMTLERRRERAAEMSCSEIMKLLRKRRARTAAREPRVVDIDAEHEAKDTP